MDIRKIIREELEDFIFDEISDEDYLLADDCELEEIDLAVNQNPGAKPGIPREFPKEKEGGTGLGMRINTGPTEFPHEEDF